MQKVILIFLLLFSSLSATKGWSNGSTTVFLPVRHTQYVLSDNIRELASNPKLYEYVESVDSKIFVALVQPSYFKFVRALTIAGYDVAIEFEDYETLTFRYFAALDATIGSDSKGNLIVISPK